VRLNGDDLIAGGSGPRDAAEAALAAATAGAHAVIVSAGVYGSVPYTIPMLDDEEGAHVELAAYVRENLSIPVLSVGGIDRPSIAEAAIARGACDAVVVGRALIADPEWVEKAALGDVGSIRPCIGLVDSCAGVLEHGGPIGCAVNPEVGRERRYRPTRAVLRRRVVVVGAGPAGMEAACCAADLGHDVVLLERAASPGGMLALAATTPPLARLARLVAWFARRLDAAGVGIRTGVEADGEVVAALDPDAVVLAIGATSAVPVLDGFDLVPTWTIEDFLDGGPSTCGVVPIPASLVVLGATRAAMAVALRGTRHGADVTLLARERLGWDASGLVRRAYKTRLAREGVEALRGRLVELRVATVVWASDDDVRAEVSTGGVVIADGRVPATFPGVDRLDGIPVTLIGDAHEPRDCAAAVSDGRQTAEAIGR
jgi:NADPH-dependent 2,4-dienoyl-CoA reductase/sulfur reductase-like enzyme